MKAKQTSPKAKQTIDKGNKITSKSLKMSKEEPEKDLKTLFNEVELSVFNEISSDFKSQLSRARDHEHVQNKLYYHWAGEFQRAQIIFSDIHHLVQDKYASNNTLEKIDAFLKVTRDEEKIKSYARYVAIGKYLNSLPQQSEETEQESDSDFVEFTTARQVMAMHYFFEEMKIQSSKKAQAKFIHFLTRKNEKNIYDHLLTPFSSKKANFRFDDLKFIRTFFEELKLDDVLLKIDKELGKETI